METDTKFIFGMLLYYGFLFTMFTLGSQYFTDIVPNSPMMTIPDQPSGNIFSQFIAGAGNFLIMVWNFFNVFFNPFQNSIGFGILSFVNWALLGASIFIFIKVIRGLP